MNIEHLKLFVRVAATQKMSQAAQDLGISAAVASTYINKLELDVGVRLVHRTTRRVSLTEEGRVFLQHAEEILNSMETARSIVGKAKLSPSGKLRITAPASFGRMHLVPAVAGFLQKYPDISIDFRLTDTIVNLVEGGFDIAIRDARIDDKTVVAKHLAPDTRLLCAAPSYIAAFGEPATPYDLLHHDCINFRGIETWSFQDGYHQEDLITIKPQGRLYVDNGEALRDACVAGAGITIGSTWSIYEHLRSGALVPLLPDYPLYSNTAIWALYSGTSMLAPKVKAFVDYYADVFGDNPYWNEGLDVDSWEYKRQL